LLPSLFDVGLADAAHYHFGHEVHDFLGKRFSHDQNPKAKVLVFPK
jgi:hypothetical protein